MRKPPLYEAKFHSDERLQHEKRQRPLGECPHPPRSARSKPRVRHRRAASTGLIEIAVARLLDLGAKLLNGRYAKCIWSVPP